MTKKDDDDDNNNNNNNNDKALCMYHTSYLQSSCNFMQRVP
jgi:hypothetical protein